MSRIVVIKAIVRWIKMMRRGKPCNIFVQEIRRKMMTFMVTYNTKNEEVIGIAHQHLHVVLSISGAAVSCHKIQGRIHHSDFFKYEYHSYTIKKSNHS